MRWIWFWQLVIRLRNPANAKEEGPNGGFIIILTLIVNWINEEVTIATSESWWVKIELIIVKFQNCIELHKLKSEHAC